MLDGTRLADDNAMGYFDRGLVFPRSWIAFTECLVILWYF